MRFITKPRRLIQVEKEMYETALEILQIEKFSLPREECEQKIFTLKALLAYKSANKNAIERDSEEEVYRCHIAYAYGYLLAAATGWKVGWIVLREKKPDDDGFAVVSPLNEYLCNPVTLMHAERASPENLFVDLYEKIKNSQLPPSEPNKFLRLVNHFYITRESIFFHPIEEATMAQLGTTIAGGLALAGSLIKEDENTFSFDPEETAKNIENCLLESKAETKKMPRSALAMLSAAYGECICQACGYVWGNSCLDTPYGELVVYRPDKVYYLKPSKILRKFLSGKIGKGELWRYCTRIQTGDLPPPENWFPEKIT
jgi:hypothetical protein